MTDNYDHYISRNIRAFYRKRLVSPILYLLLLLVLWLVFPLREMLSPQALAPGESLQTAFESGNVYASVEFSDLTFSGYTSEAFGRTNGYFYYGLFEDQCLIVLLSPSTCEEGLPFIERISVQGKILEGKESYDALLSRLASDLDWTKEGIISQMPAYYFSEPAGTPIVTQVLFVLYFGTMLYAGILLVLYLLYIRFPVVSPPCQNLIVFGSPSKMLEQAEEELATLPQLATEDMFITENYFIATSPYGNAFVPIQDILWIYKHSTLHKFLWYHFSISYTLHITANRHLYIRCPKNLKSDIDGIIDYLAEANHNILVGFSEENRLKVQEELGKPFHIEKLYAFLRKKI